MEAITASLERSLQNCSLNNDNHQSRRENGSAADAALPPGLGISSTSDHLPDTDNNHNSNSDTTLELNSHISLPYHWEQCLDLKVQSPLSFFSFPLLPIYYYFFLLFSSNKSLHETGSCLSLTLLLLCIPCPSFQDKVLHMLTTQNPRKRIFFFFISFFFSLLSIREARCNFSELDHPQVIDSIYFFFFFCYWGI